MPHIDELSIAYQSALKRSVPAIIRPKVVFDPDGANIDLSAYLSNNPLIVSREVPVQNFGQSGRFVVNNVRISFNNISNYISRHNQSSPFYYAKTRLVADKDTADTFIWVEKGDARKFENVTTGYLVDAFGIFWEFTISSIDTTDPEKDKINFTSGGGTSGLTGYLFETALPIGKTVRISQSVDGVSGDLQEFEGVLLDFPELRNDGATAILEVQEKSISLLNKSLSANNFRYFEPATLTVTSTKEMTLQSGSTGTFTETNMVISAGCPMGNWQITFTSSGGYDLRAPNGEVMTTNSILFTVNFIYNGATVLSFPSTCWGGTFVTGDIITFTTTHTFATLSAADNIESLLTSSYAGGISAGALDDDSFNNASIVTVRSSFSQQTSVLAAIEEVQKHGSMALFIDAAGKFKLFDYTYQSAAATLDEDEDLMDVQTASYGYIDRFEYDFNHDLLNSNYYGKDYSVARGGVGNTVYTQSLRFPFFRDETNLDVGVQRIIDFWSEGVTPYDLQIKYNYGFRLDIGDTIEFSSTVHGIDAVTARIIGVQKDLVNKLMTVRCVSMPFRSSEYAIIGTHDFSDGKRLL